MRSYLEIMVLYQKMEEILTVNLEQVLEDLNSFRMSSGREIAEFNKIVLEDSLGEDFDELVSEYKKVENFLERLKDLAEDLE